MKNLRNSAIISVTEGVVTDEKIRETILSNIQNRLGELGITGAELGRRAFGDGKHYLYDKFARGETVSPKIGTIVRIARALGMTVGELLDEPGATSGTIPASYVPADIVRAAAYEVCDYARSEGYKPDIEDMADAIRDLALEYAHTESTNKRPRLMIDSSTVVFPPRPKAI